MPLYSTGSNSNGQTSQASLEDSSNFNLCQFLTSNKNIEILDLKFGGTHTLALASSSSSDGAGKELYVCGCNSKGQLGFPVLPSLLEVEERNKNNNEILNNNYTSFQLLPLELLLSLLQPSIRHSEHQIEAIAASWDTSFVLLSSKYSNQSDLLLSFGGNDWGELGIGIKGHSVASPTSGLIHRIELKKLLEGNDKEGYFKIRKLVAGPRHIIILAQVYSSSNDVNGEYKLIGWGVSRHGQLGITNEKILLSPTILNIPLLIPGSVKDIRIGRDHTLLLYERDQVMFLGSIKGGIRDINLDETISTTIKKQNLEIDCSWSGVYLLSAFTSILPLSSVDVNTLTKTITALGSNSHSQLAQLPSSLISTSTLIPISLPPHLKILKLSAGSEHVLVLTFNEQERRRELWAWGWNEHGNLGDGSKIDREVPKLVWKEGVKKVDEVARSKKTECWAGNATSWIYVED